MARPAERQPVSLQDSESSKPKIEKVEIEPLVFDPALLPKQDELHEVPQEDNKVMEDED